MKPGLDLGNLALWLEWREADQLNTIEMAQHKLTQTNRGHWQLAIGPTVEQLGNIFATWSGYLSLGQSEWEIYFMSAKMPVVR